MSESQVPAVIHDSQKAAKVRSGGVAASVGQRAIYQVRGLIQLTGIAVAVFRQSLRPLTWRRTVRAELFAQCHQVGIHALPFILITGSLVGFGIVYQAIYWLDLFGQTEYTAPILVTVLVREVTPLFVALIVIGRSGAVILVELGNMRIDGQIRMLDAQGIDPFLFLILPRVVAVSVCMFSLTIAFIAVALVSGFLAGNALGSMDFTLYDFISRILSDMEPADFATIPLKTSAIGFVVSLIAGTTGLSVRGSRSDLLAELPRYVTKSALAALLISILLTLLL
jgi:phospholipid/cholesterol/gamma-HCH transport system permease protein